MFDLGNAESAISHKETKSVTTITYTGDDGKVDVKVPLLPAIGQTYNIALETAGFTATVNSDGTYTVSDNANIESEKWQNAVTNTMIQVTANGSIHSSYKETTMTITGSNILYSSSTEEQIDAAYADYGEITALRQEIRGLNHDMRNLKAETPQKG
jgi:flagellar hook-associated protein 3 FlgL